MVISDSDSVTASAVLTPPLAEPKARDLCTDCGISRSQDPRRCGRACQFIEPNYTRLERDIHGRERNPASGDELHFGHYLAMYRARLEPRLAESQWTGITTRLGERLLETGAVDAVLATASYPDDPWRPRPVIVTEPAGMAQCRGMKMGFSPLLALLDQAAEFNFKRIAVIGIPCQVYALRALEHELGLERLWVIGTPCSDNTSTEHFHTFLDLLTDRPEQVKWLEFMPDYHVEMHFTDDSQQRIPFIQLPIADLPDDFFPLTCRSCVDYTNALADITVGYLGGSGAQWVIVRNHQGQELLELLGNEIRLEQPESRGNRKNAVAGYRDTVAQSVDGLPVRRAPKWVRPLIGFMMTHFGPKGLELARTRVEMKAVEAVLCLRRFRPERLKWMVPKHVLQLAARYNVTAEADPEMQLHETTTKVSQPASPYSEKT